MNARTISMAASSENSNRSGHQGASPAPASAPASIAKVEPTYHQLTFTDSSTNGTVALIRSFPIRNPSLVSAESWSGFGASSYILQCGRESPVRGIISPSSWLERAYAGKYLYEHKRAKSECRHSWRTTACGPLRGHRRRVKSKDRRRLIDDLLIVKGVRTESVLSSNACVDFA